MSSARRRAGRLTRISDARDGDTDGVDRQGVRTLELCGREDWDDGGLYVENDTSAFKRKRILLPDGSYGLRTVRPEFRRWLNDLSSGAITAGAAIDLDRVARDPRDLEDLIDVVEATGHPVKACTGSLDLSTDAGIFTARVLVGHANMSSRDTSRRVADKHAVMASQGRYAGGGRRPFGYARDGITIDPEEAAAVRMMAEMYVEGCAFSEIAAHLDDQRIPTVYGRPWNARTVGSILASPRIAGLRIHRGEIIAEAQWPAIIGRDAWDDLQVEIRTRRGAAPGAFQRWLTGVMFCGRPNCGHRIRGWNSRTRQIYWCPKLLHDPGCGKLTVVAQRAEERAEDLLFAALADPEQLAILNAATDQDAGARARREIAEDEAQLADMAAMWGRRELTKDEYLAGRKEVVERLKKAKAVRAAAVPSEVRRLLSSGDIAQGWSALAALQKREVIRVVFPDGLVLLPATRLGQVFDPERIQLRRPEQAA